MTTTALLTSTSPTAPTAISWADLAADIGRQLAEEVADFDRRGDASVAAFDLLRQRGVLSALVPVEFGGGGATHREAGTFIRVLGRSDPSTALTLSMHTHVLAAQVWRHRRGMDASAVFAKVVDGAMLVSTGATDFLSSGGTVTPVDGGYRVSGTKAPVSGCEIGNVYATMFRWDDHPDGPQVIHCTVPRTAEGVSTRRSWDALGMRATGSDTVVFDGVFVPDAAVSLIRPADRWHPIWNVVMGAAMPLIMSAYLGVADAIVQRTIELRGSAASPGEPHVVQMIGEMINAHVTADDLVAAMFNATDDLDFDNTDELASRVLSRKSAACEALLACARLGMEAAGGVGFSRGDQIERLFRDIHGCVYHPLPRAKQTSFTGRLALGLEPMR